MTAKGQAPRWRFSADGQAIDARFGIPRASADAARAALRLAPGDRVLEAGCGTGGFSAFALPALEGRGRWVAVDADPGHVPEARATLVDAPVPVDVAAADAFRLPFRDASFDAVVSQFLLCILPEPVRALREMARVVKPGGVVASVSCFCKSGSPRFGGLGAWDGREEWEALEARFRTAYRTRVRNPGLGLPNGRDLDVWGDYARAGLEDLRIDGYMACFAPGDARWSVDDAREYVQRRERIDCGLLDNLSDADHRALEDAGVTRGDVERLRELTTERYRDLARDVEEGRRNMDVMVDPAVLISGHKPRAREAAAGVTC